MNFLSTSFSDFPTHHKISDFFPISRLGVGSLSELKFQSCTFRKTRKKKQPKTPELVGVSSAV